MEGKEAVSGSAESPTFRVGQEVQVSYRARVAEVIARSAVADGGPALRLEPVDGTHHSPPGGWVDPTQVIVEVTADALPDKPGIYWANDEDQHAMDRWHTDGKQFHYLNTSGQWCDVGWGQPNPGMVLNGPLVELPF